MTIAFRNVDVSPEDPVSDWPTEAVLTALERGGLSHWRRLAEAVVAAPWGPVARRVEEALAVGQAYGTAELMEAVITGARNDAQARERAAVAEEVTALVSRSGLTRAEFARAIGTSPSRLSTYATGVVTPSAALMVRMRAVGRG